jgi:mannitol-specific phosphotransferase system IIBC component
MRQKKKKKKKKERREREQKGKKNYRICSTVIFDMDAGIGP